MPLDKKPAAPDFCLKAALEAEFPAKGDLRRLIPQVPDIQRPLTQSVPTSGDWPGPCQAPPSQTSSISTPFRADRSQPLALHLAHGERLPNDGRTANGSGISAEPRGGRQTRASPQVPRDKPSRRSTSRGAGCRHTVWKLSTTLSLVTPMPGSAIHAGTGRPSRQRITV